MSEENQLDLSRPLFEQVAQKIRIEIAKGELKPGQKIDGLNDLAKTYGVSQAVISKSLKRLEQDALIVADKFRDYYITLAIPRIELVKARLVDNYAKEFVYYAQKYGLSFDEATEVLKQEWDEFNELNS